MPIRKSGLISAAILALGALLPWATVTSVFGTISVAGTHGDGVLTLLCAVAIGVMFGLWKRPALIVAAVLAGIASLVGVIDLVNIGRAAADLGGFIDASPGIGLFLTVLAAIAALVLGVMGSAAVGKAPAAFEAPAYGVAPPSTASYGGVTLYPTAAGPATAYPQAGPATAYPQAGPATAHPAATAFQPAGSAYPPAAPAAPVPPASQAAPAGWQPDPYHQAQWRYWDGARWTERVQ